MRRDGAIDTVAGAVEPSTTDQLDPPQTGLAPPAPGGEEVPIAEPVVDAPGPSAARLSLGWMLSGRVVQVVLLFVGSVIVSRYLGPESLGVLGVATAFAVMFGPFSAIGDLVVVRDLTQEPRDAPAVLGSAALMSGSVGVAAYVVMVGAAMLFVDDRADLVLLISIVGASLLISPLRIIGYWFEATLQAKYLAIAGTSAVVISTLARVGVVAMGGGLRGFAWCIAAEQFLVGVFTLAFYLRNPRRVRHWQVRLDVVRRTLRQSFPLVISGVAMAVYSRVDQVMLGALSTERQTGLYSAVVRLSEATTFVAMSVVTSFAPSVARLRATDLDRYRQQILRLMSLLSGLALTYAIPVAALSTVIVSVVLGPRFDGAGPVLAIHVVSTLFVFLGLGQTIWTVNESLQGWAMARTISGAALNIALNFVLIPPFGALGAAYATLIAYAWSGWIGNLLARSTRPMFWIQLRSLDPRRVARVGLAEYRNVRH